MVDAVAHIVSSLNIGGAERLVVDLSCAQRRAGLAVSIVTLGEGDQPLATAAQELGVHVVDVGHRPSHLARWLALATVLANRPDQVVHVHNPWALRAVLPVLPLVRGRVVYTRHGPSRYPARAWRVIHAIARRFVHGVTFVTDDARRSFEDTHGAWRRGLVVENGVAVAPTPPSRSAAGRLRIGSVGRLVELKGQRFLLDAVAALTSDARANVEIHLFGEGPEHDRLAEHARDRLAGVPVVFHGTVLDRDRIYATIDVLVVGSRMEGLSMAVMEAMARGIPVIATDVGGNRRLVRDGVTGMLVAHGDVAAIRDAIAQLVADEALCTRLGHAGHRLIETEYSIDAIATRYRTLYSAS